MGQAARRNLSLEVAKIAESCEQELAKLRVSVELLKDLSRHADALEALVQAAKRKTTALLVFPLVASRAFMRWVHLSPVVAEPQVTTSASAAPAPMAAVASTAVIAAAPAVAAAAPAVVAKAQHVLTSAPVVAVSQHAPLLRVSPAVHLLAKVSHVVGPVLIAAVVSLSTPATQSVVQISAGAPPSAPPSSSVPAVPDASSAAPASPPAPAAPSQGAAGSGVSQASAPAGGAPSSATTTTTTPPPSQSTTTSTTPPAPVTLQQVPETAQSVTPATSMGVQAQLSVNWCDGDGHLCSDGGTAPYRFELG